MNGNPKADTGRRVAKAAASCRSTRCSERRPKQLSGGQRQRVAIGRAIVPRARGVPASTSPSQPDAELARADAGGDRPLHSELGATMIYVTHDQTEAMTLGQPASSSCARARGAGGRAARPLQRSCEPVRAGFIGSLA
jgi:lactose/L-arabinose transport system ATP-binding protein